MTTAAVDALVELEAVRSGQLRLGLPGTPRRRYPTGQQVPCAACAAGGVDRLGVSRDGPGSPPECMSCWRGRLARRGQERDKALLARSGQMGLEDRPALSLPVGGLPPRWDTAWAGGVGAAGRRLAVELERAVAEAEAAACPVCGPGREAEQLVDELLPPAAVAVRRRRRRYERRQRRRAARRGRVTLRRSVPAAGCWWCEHVWLVRARERFERDQAEAVAEQAAEVEAEFGRIAAGSEAEDRVAELRAWVERLVGVVEAYRRGGGRGRAVELLADLLARATAASASGRGRPSVLALVAAVLAVDADYRSGRRAMPGRERTAWLAGVSSRAVYSGWQRAEALGAVRRTRRGGRNSLERRIEVGRALDRAEFDWAPLHRSPVAAAARAAQVPAALAVLDELLARAAGLLQEAEAARDELVGRDHTARVARARMRVAVARAHQAVTDTLARLGTANFCHTHTVLTGEYISSSSVVGLSYTSSITSLVSGGPAGPAAGRRKDGASRSPTKSSAGDLGLYGPLPGSPPLKRPRPLQAVRSRPHRTARHRPEWAAWAGHLRDGLVELWPWLAREPRAWVTAALGARLGPDWTPGGLVRWVTGRHGRAVLPDPYNPLGYLCHLLDEALTGDVEPPHAARRHAEHARQVAATAGEDLRARRATARAGYAARDAAAAPAGAGRAAARAEMARINAARTARGRAEADRAARLAACDWPEVAQPGSGLPDPSPP